MFTFAFVFDGNVMSRRTLNVAVLGQLDAREIRR
jgi:hypothetical protein